MVSSRLKKYKKNVTKNKLQFDNDMYNNIYGSFGVAYFRCYSLMNSKEDTEKLRLVYKKLWKRMARGRVKLPFIDDKEFVNKMCEIYGIKDFPYGSIAIVKGDMNSLFTPCYIENGKVQILPLKENGEVGVTLTFGKPFVILKDEIE